MGPSWCDSSTACKAFVVQYRGCDSQNWFSQYSNAKEARIDFGHNIAMFYVEYVSQKDIDWLSKKNYLSNYNELFLQQDCNYRTLLFFFS